MIKSSYFAGKKVVVFGLSRTGVGAVKSMIASSAIVVASDDNESQLNTLKLQFPIVHISKPQDIEWERVDFLLLSPGIPLYAPVEHPVVTAANKHNVSIISDIDVLYIAHPTVKFIGITGTNGKSTTTALIAHIFKECGQKAQVGGNIGISALELDPQDDGYYVLELSSYQLDLIKFLHTDIALIINITPDHIDRHGSFSRYVEAKSKLIKSLSPEGTVVISVDYPTTRQLAETYTNNITKNKVTISTQNQKSDIYISNRILNDHMRNLSFDFNNYRYLPGEHNQENIAAAYAICVGEGLKPKEVV